MTVTSRAMRPNDTRGWVVFIIMFIVVFLLVLGSSLIYFMRQESSQAFAYAQAQVALHAAETGIEHAMYMLKHHANDQNENPPYSWQKDFGTKEAFEAKIDMVSPYDAPWPMLAVKIDEAVKARTQGATLDSITIKWKREKELSEIAKVGVLSISAIGRYQGSVKEVRISRRVFVHKDIPIQFDHALYVNNKTKEAIPARRNKEYTGLKRVVGFFAGNWAQQSFFVNGKVFARNLYVALNKESDNSLFGGAISTAPSMIDKLSDKRVDLNTGYLNGAYGDSGLKELQNEVPIVGGIIGLFSQKYREVDANWLGSAWNGGTRGNVDLTGFDPAGTLKKFFTAIGFKDKKDRTPNKLIGDINRVYKKDGNVIVEPYATPIVAPGTDPLPPPPAATGLYPPANHFIYGKDSKLAKDEARYPLDKIEGVMDAATYKEIASKKRTDVTNVSYKVGKNVVTQPAVHYHGFGPWAAAPNSTGLLGPIKDLFKKKTGKEAALANPSFAIKLSGVHFVDGDVAIEGVYKGRGTIVATGNIYVGNELVRHPTDGSGMSVMPDGSANDGAWNSLSLVALGTRLGPGGEPTGKVIFRTLMDEGYAQPGILRNLFEGKKDMAVQAFIYAKNGVKGEFEDDSWFGLGGDKKVYTVVTGNVVGDTLGLGDFVPTAPDDKTRFKDERANWPDQFAIKEDPKWIWVFEQLLKNTDRWAVSVSPRLISYWQGRPQ